MTTHDGPRAPDRYEAEYMSGEPVRYRDKIKASRAFHLLLAVVTLLPLVTLGSLVWVAASTGQPVPAGVFVSPAIMTVLLPLLWILFSVLRVTVTDRSVFIQYGLFGPRIPLDRIDRCEAVTYNWQRYGGWGIRRGADGSIAYNIMGDAGRGVRITWRNDKGKEVVHVIASPNPEGLARGILEARAALAAQGGAAQGGAAQGGAAQVRVGGPRARVAGAGDAGEAEREVEAELEGDAEGRSGERKRREEP